MALSRFDFSQPAVGDVAAAHLQLGRQLFLGQTARQAKPADVLSQRFLMGSFHGTSLHSHLIHRGLSA